jgi:site-specific DNA recombinase
MSVTNNMKRTLIYCRESRDDFGENYERIETQRDILLNFCKREGYTNIVDVILDDNVSGTNFKRLENIVQMAKNGEIDAIVFKDASRLGRNQIESLKFIDAMEKNNVEVVFESEKYNEDFFPLLAWFNEQRAKEDSKKIRRVFKHKMESGELIIKPPYGYKKENNKLEIQPNEAKVVKEIYERFLNGEGTYKIATALNYAGIPTPSQSRHEYVGNGNIAYAWNRQHIYRILSDERYTGMMIYSKREVISYKNKKIFTKDESEWIKIPNHHEPLITAEQFEDVQNRKRQLKFEKNKSINPRLFTGILVCGRCGSGMVQRVQKNRKDCYICSKNHREGAIKDHIRDNYGCKSHRLFEEKLTKVVMEYLHSFLNDVQPQNIFEQNGSLQDYNAVKKQKMIEIDRLEKILMQIYDDKLNGLINQDIYLKKQKEYTDKLTISKNDLNRIEQILNGSSNSMKDRENFIKLIKEVDRDGLSNKLLKQLFEKIVYFLPEEITQEFKQKFNISNEWYEQVYKNGGLFFVGKRPINFGVTLHI